MSFLFHGVDLVQYFFDSENLLVSAIKREKREHQIVMFTTSPNMKLEREREN